MDLRQTWISSPSKRFQPMSIATTGEFLHRFRFEFNGCTFECPSKIISDFLLAEYEFRVVSQLKEGEKGDRKNEGMRDGLKTKYVRCERNLYFKFFALPNQALEKMRRFVFKNTGWYMRTTLTDHCDHSGGCCGQDCGCCEKRKDHLPRRGMNGHCTWACHCCIERKGLSFKDYDGDGFEKQYKDALESDNPVFLLRMADGYFVEPKSRPDSNQKPNSKSGDDTQSNPQDAIANDDAKAMAKEAIQLDSSIDLNSDPCPPPYNDSELAKDDGERKKERGWPWKRF